VSKLKVQVKSKVQMTKLNKKALILRRLGIHFAFACLPVGRDFDIWAFPLLEEMTEGITSAG
jgi:hypothetical protein